MTGGCRAAQAGVRSPLAEAAHQGLSEACLGLSCPGPDSRTALCAGLSSPEPPPPTPQQSQGSLRQSRVMGPGGNGEGAVLGTLPACWASSHSWDWGLVTTARGPGMGIPYLPSQAHVQGRVGCVPLVKPSMSSLLPTALPASPSPVTCPQRVLGAVCHSSAAPTHPCRVQGMAVSSRQPLGVTCALGKGDSKDSKQLVASRHPNSPPLSCAHLPHSCAHTSATTTPIHTRQHSCNTCVHMLARLQHPFLHASTTTTPVCTCQCCCYTHVQTPALP